jgi:hypothetical protein
MLIYLLSTKDTGRSASYHDVHFEIDSEDRLRTKLYDQRDYFNFHILNFPLICSNIPAASEATEPMVSSGQV